VPDVKAVGIVASNMARSIAFCSLLGLDLPETPDASWGHWSAQFEDPDGARVDLYARH
jgi:hypothetical protein